MVMVVYYLLFQRIKIINDDTNEEVECKETATHNEDDKVEVVMK